MDAISVCYAFVEGLGESVEILTAIGTLTSIITQVVLKYRTSIAWSELEGYLEEFLALQHKFVKPGTNTPYTRSMKTGKQIETEVEISGPPQHLILLLRRFEFGIILAKAWHMTLFWN